MSKTRKTSLSQVFDRVYKQHRWMIGSGTGSISFLNRKLIHFVNRFLADYPDVKTVLDVGCGDWKIARHFNLANQTYIGVDVSAHILKRTAKKYSQENIQFVHLDATTDDLPAADLVIVKDVLIHLSNENVKKVLEKLGPYPYVIIQNDIYSKPCENRDIPDGHFRPLDISRPPFESHRYPLHLTYTEGFRLLPNVLRRLTPTMPSIRKGIFCNF